MRSYVCGNMPAITKAPREQNIEALRIVLMIMIVCHHFLMRGRGLHLLYTSGSTTINADALHGLFIDSFLIMTVNCFVFISGYYGIKFRIHTVLSLFIQAVTYSILIDLVSGFFTGDPVTIDTLWDGLLSVPDGQWWFITTYFFLYLLSPLLNLPKKYLNRFQFLYLLGILTLINFIVAFLLDPSSLGVLNGYSLFSFSCIYFYGQAFNSHLLIKRGKYHLFAVYLLCALLIFAMFYGLLRYATAELAWKAFSYNNPLVMISAISFFFLFKNLKIRWTGITFFSSSVLAVYLIHEHPKSADFLTAQLNQIALAHQVGNVYFTFLVIAVLLFLAGTLVEKLRAAVTNPGLNYLISRFRLDRFDQKINL